MSLERFVVHGAPDSQLALFLFRADNDARAAVYILACIINE